jgi:hypothetical protein
MPAKAEAMVKSIKESLRKSHPKWSEEQISSRAYASVQSFWKKKFGKPAF